MKSYLNLVRLRGAAAAILILSSICVCGCGGKSSKGATLSGKVTFKDQPLTGGSIMLHSIDGKKQFPGTISPDGTFAIGGLTSGEMVVTIETESIKGQTGVAYKVPPGQKAPEMKVKLAKYVPIPKTYGDVNSSPLRATVKSGSNKKEFNLSESGQ